MVSKCATPECSAQFRSLRNGKLFVFHWERPAQQRGQIARSTECFWLCADCARYWTLRMETEKAGVVVIRKPRGQTAAPSRVALDDAAPAA